MIVKTYLCLLTLSTFLGLATCAGTMKLLFRTGRLRRDTLPNTEGAAEPQLFVDRISHNNGVDNNDKKQDIGTK